MKIIGLILEVSGVILLGVFFIKLVISLIKKRNDKKKWLIYSVLSLFLLFIGAGILAQFITPEQHAAYNQQLELKRQAKLEKEKEKQQQIELEPKKVDEEAKKIEDNSSEKKGFFSSLISNLFYHKEDSEEVKKEKEYKAFVRRAETHDRLSGNKKNVIGKYSVMTANSDEITEELLAYWYKRYIIDKNHDFSVIWYSNKPGYGIQAQKGQIIENVKMATYNDEKNGGECEFTMLNLGIGDNKIYDVDNDGNLTLINIK